jgi:HSP20 family protein
MTDPYKRRRSPWDDLFSGFGDLESYHEEMRERMDRLLDSFLQGEMDEEPVIYGFSMRMGPDGVPHVQEFGNASPQGRKETREPLTDVIEEPEHVRIIAELPGVSKENIDLRINQRSVDILVDEPDRKYSKRIDLPVDVDPDTSVASYNNGVLEMTVKRSASLEEGKRVAIE